MKKYSILLSFVHVFLAFSLVELTVAMVIISIILAAFMPVITKNLKTNNAIVKMEGMVKYKCEKFSSDCKLCYKNGCLLCDKTCTLNEFKSIKDCSCQKCSDKYDTNCISCTDSECKACKAGYGLNSSPPFCKICSAGEFSDGKKACQICPNGKYTAAAGQASCILCEEGSYCLNGKKNSCGAKKWSNVGAKSLSDCYPCPAGFYCDGQNPNHKQPCGSKKWSDAGQASSLSSCKDCPAGNACVMDGNNNIKSECKDGQFAQTGSSKCATCTSAGCKTCEKTTGKCLTCEAGKYLKFGKCETCTSGYWCPGEDSDKISCTGANKYCLTCDKKTGGCLTCPSGRFLSSAAGNVSTVCSPCPAGKFYCPGGDDSSKHDCSSSCSSCNNTTGACASCENGYYKTGTLCTSCSEKGCKACDKSSGTCTDCDEGKYLSKGACVSCSSKTPNCAQCDLNSGECTKCSGSYLLSTNKFNNTQYTSIPADFQCHDISKIQKVNAGDSGGLSIPSTVTVCTVNQPCSCTGANACCFIGQTSFNCNATNSTYSGCYRTVCNLGGAREICKAYGMRVPNVSEMKYWASLSVPYGDNGLKLCSSASNSITPFCSGRTDGCLGINRLSSSCQPYVVWGNDVASTEFGRAYVLYDFSSWETDRHHQEITAGVRCVSN